MMPLVRKANQVTEFETPERCFILEVSNDEGDSNVSISRARVPVGVTTEWHRLSRTDERYIIVAGQGYVEIGELRCDVTVGDVARIPAELPQRITNTGVTDLVFFCVCTPRFAPDCYIPIST